MTTDAMSPAAGGAERAAALAKLVRLVPRLASDHDSEVIASVYAIARTLAGAGLDWHDVGGALCPPPRREPPTGLRDLLDAAEWYRARDGLLNPREADFVGTVVRQLAARRPISPKQQGWLAPFHDGLRGGVQ